ncbi:hypothetical protein CO009_03540 [Candidatus Shapirobacteria bacterium CG_4_8_14_3_um_filter_35_11]|uniref:Uncharacterized protein n=5 Tax=Candidatus Shapironibacteriota TaxID=1752721 RepID=A0A1J5HP98_9BACT|nr:MAG: hypothetical protein AUK05_03335 [Candidatus Shapirobacteria bacterium CG2_30_35_20]PIV07561.1 MAG: hypothetical protein COS53_01770 [Candidatus Shapirobacteria bacterium CG03_land_8_20_14_0_80_35_14]PIX67774.1 MAG: hypothetical protein COZ41_03215 [Candidatus Shapirobacteria bacterium CG_4_10_14_3_um_filter_35_13]PJA50854.1 MAG: hypothetical protein CO168_02875 [Candidatus Shapirobacteria bacterium CG_4_9_14_3_um_filter_36_12]PJC79759.1 MAG: hypothetical protein CO009_03540 [Candidatus
MSQISIALIVFSSLVIDILYQYIIILVNQNFIAPKNSKKLWIKSILNIIFSLKKIISLSSKSQINVSPSCQRGI